MSDMSPRLSGARALPRLSLGSAPITTLSFEGYDLRVLTVRGRAIERFISTPFDPALIPDGVVQDAQTFGEALRITLTEHEVAGNVVRAAFPAAHALARLLTLPKVGQDVLRDMVRRESKRAFLIEPAEYHIFHQPVAEHGNEMRVYVIAVRKDMLEPYLAGLRAAGLYPDVVELRPLAIVRAVNQPHTIIANVERSSFDIVIVSNNVPAVMRSLLLHDGEAGAGQANLVDELEHTIAFYNDSNRERPLSPRLPVVLTGELADAQELQDALRERLDREISQVSCPFACPAGFAVGNFAVNIGLAQRSSR